MVTQKDKPNSWVVTGCLEMYGMYGKAALVAGFRFLNEMKLVSSEQIVFHMPEFVFEF